MNCVCNNLTNINGFDSLLEYKKFLSFIQDQIKEGTLTEIQPQENYFEINSFNKDRWFTCSSCNKKWRLVNPDFPFKGLFEEIIFPLSSAVRKNN